MDGRTAGNFDKLKNNIIKIIHDNLEYTWTSGSHFTIEFFPFMEKTTFYGIFKCLNLQRILRI